MILNKLTSIINSANADYAVEYDEATMFNVRADGFDKGHKFAYIEEFREGEISVPKYFLKESTKMQIAFSQITEIRLSALEREEIREEIKKEIVKPFIEAYNKSTDFEKVNRFKTYTPLARFDANEISVVLEFDCVEVENNCE